MLQNPFFAMLAEKEFLLKNHLSCIAPQRSAADRRSGVWNLYSAFNSNYDAYINGDMRDDQEKFYEAFGAPAPSQYRAFRDFFEIVKKPESGQMPDYVFLYESVRLKRAKPPMLVFARNLAKQYDARGKEIILTSGSFWNMKRRIGVRIKLIEAMNKLCRRGAKARIVAEAKQGGISLKRLNSRIEQHFEIKNRVPMHFMLAGDDYLFVEFPHTETSVFRLDMFLDLNDSRIYQNDKKKEDVLAFLKTLYERV